MNTAAIKSAFVLAVLTAPFVSAADRGAPANLPAPLHVMNMSPSFANHPGDLTLLARLPTAALKSNTGGLTFTSKPGTEGAEANRTVALSQVKIEDLRFNARLEGASMKVQLPQSGLLKFTPANEWNFKKAN